MSLADALDHLHNLVNMSFVQDDHYHVAFETLNDFVEEVLRQPFVVEVSGGVAEIIQKPGYIAGVVVDWDNAKDDPNQQPSLHIEPAEKMSDQYVLTEAAQKAIAIALRSCV